MTWLVADIGGTNARFALCEAEAGRPILRGMASLTAAAHPAIEDAIAAYLAKAAPGERIEAAAFAVACPARDERILFTNSPWTFERRKLAAHFHWSALKTLNDFEALALGIPAAPAAAFHRLRPGERQENAPCALLGPGTGLGVSGLLPDRAGHWVAIAGEGGHIEFAPRDENEIEFLRFMIARKGRCSAERVLSGAGLTNIYEFLADGRGRRDQRLDPAAISAAALAGSDDIAVATLDFFLGALGSLAGDLALLLGATGGVYLGGGILPRLLPIFAKSPFLTRFADKGRLSYVLTEVPVFLLQDSVIALLGAAGELMRERGDG